MRKFNPCLNQSQFDMGLQRNVHWGLDIVYEPFHDILRVKDGCLAFYLKLAYFLR